ncbi:MAG: gamma-glutamyltransferase [Rhodospirillaceae bacterium]|nr:gamma-glutamyltransferase [Rhodospirillaceae bacterium]
MVRYSRACLILAACLAPTPTLWAQDFVSPEAATGRYQKTGGEAKKFMVAAANPLAVQAGVDMLKAGGSAIDAAVAVQTVLNMVEPQSSGIGGGSFIVYWDNATKTLTTYDGRETAPAAATERRFLTAEGKSMDRATAVNGGHSVGVPGTVRVLDLAHKKHGKLPWARLFDPALKIADEGFALSPRVHELIALDRALGSMEPAKSFFYQPDGTAKPVGTIIKNPAFAATLRTIATKGADAFYMGPIAEDIVRAVTSSLVNPGDLTLDDLKNYKAVERAPICLPYRDRKVCGMAPPTSGGVGVLQTLALLEPFDLGKMSPDSALAQHAYIEASRLAFADRAVYIADPDVLPIPTAELLSPAYLKARAALISLDKRLSKAEAGQLPRKAAFNWVPAGSPEKISTSHFSIVDGMGNAVAMTTSIEGGFGSHVMVRGFMLNNTLTDFSYSDAAEGKVVANAVGPGKRPRSSMAPTVVFDKDGKLEMVVGSPGGPAIVGFVTQTLIAMIDWNMTPQDAIASPHVVVFGNAVNIEPELTPIKSALEALGHQVRVGEFPSGIHAIRITKQGLLGGADPRREGAVGGE